MVLNKRTTQVDELFINALIFSSILEIGDSYICSPRATVLAVQKEGATFRDEGYAYDQYEIFNRPFPRLSQIYDVTKTTVNHSPNIHVEAIHIEGVSTSSIIQLGSLDHIEAEARVKHIRQLQG